MNPPIPDAAIGAIVAATITGLVTLLGLIISKENKTSEFREFWIDDLRAELSLLIAHVNAMHAAMCATSHRQEAWKLAPTDFLQANRCITSIRLRLNAKEKSSQAILTLLLKYEQLFADGATPNINELAPTHHEMVAASQKVLKSEWRRVRHGEMVFQIARGASFAFLLAGLVSLLFLWLRIE